MEYKIFTNRHDADKIAYDMSLMGGNSIVNIDKADVDAIRAEHAIKYAITLNSSLLDGKFIEDVKEVVKLSGIRLSDISISICNIRVGNDDIELVTASDITSVLNALQYIYEEDGYTKSTDVCWSIGGSPELGGGDCEVYIAFAVRKSDEDRSEDEKYDKLIAEYLEAKLSAENIGSRK